MPMLVTLSAALAIISGTVVERLQGRELEVWTEAIGWTVVFSVYRQRGQDKRQQRKSLKPSTSRTLWLVAFCIVLVSVFKAWFGVVGFFPLLTPLLLFVEQCFEQNTNGRIPQKTPWYLYIVDKRWDITVVAIFTTGSLTQFRFREHTLALIPTATLLLIYTCFTPRPAQCRFSRASPPLDDIEGAILPLCTRVVTLFALLLSFEVTLFGKPFLADTNLLKIGFSKGAYWVYLIRLVCLSDVSPTRDGISSPCRRLSWRIATTIITFVILANCDPFMQPSDLVSYFQIGASFLAFCQTMCLMPKEARHRWALWLLFLLALVPFYQSMTLIQTHPSVTGVGEKQHPVAALVEKAETDFERMLQRQSQTYTAACADYRRRYSMAPPPGFDTWFALAHSSGSPIIDDFDTLYDSLEPLWALSGRGILDNMNKVQQMSGSDLWQCTFTKKDRRVSCNHPNRSFDRHYGLMLNSLLNSSYGLGDVHFLVNHLDEPRVVFPSPPRNGDHGQISVTDMARRPVYNSITKSCSQQTKRQQSTSSLNSVDTYGMPFVTDVKYSLNLCKHPEYDNEHGMLMSPTSFPLIEGFVPVLSTGALSTMGDLVFPSPAYEESSFIYNSSKDIPWERKHNSLYWVGSTTGGYAKGDNNWSRFHRQRFVRLAQNLDHQNYPFLSLTDNKTGLVSAKPLYGRWFNVGFARIFQCARQACHRQRLHYPFQPWESKDEALQSRLVFDLDGNGISGRYMKLLASNSAPLKQTLLREWHDDRLVPWLHYIPVSQHLQELPELVAYLTSNEEGQKMARKIAYKGQVWHGKALRHADMAIYVQRLMLELARLQDPARPAGKPK